MKTYPCQNIEFVHLIDSTTPHPRKLVNFLLIYWKVEFL